MMVLGGRAFGRQLGIDEGVRFGPHDRISVLIKRPYPKYLSFRPFYKRWLLKCNKIQEDNKSLIQSIELFSYRDFQAVEFQICPS